MKLFAAINAKQLDLVLMNREAYDLCSHYLRMQTFPAKSIWASSPTPHAWKNAGSI